MSSAIHPTACIDPRAHLGNEVTIGPYSVIAAEVTLGDGCVIGPHVVIQPYTTLGRNNVVHPHVVLGDLPQDMRFNANTPSRLIIGDHNVFREGFTAHRATTEHGATVIGNRGYFMNHSHVAHDCQIGDEVIFANNVAIGGFVEVGSRAFLGGNVVAHQFCRIGAYAMVQGTTGLNKDVLPFMLIGGRPARHYKLNTVGLRRAGITGERYRVLAEAQRRLRGKQPLDDLPETEELYQLKTWLAGASKRGLHRFVAIDGVRMESEEE